MSKINVVTASPDDPNTLSLLASSLRQRCAEVPEDVIPTQEFRRLVALMFEIMYANDGAGLAAPQVGIQWRLATIHPSDESTGPTVIINPVLKHKSEEEEDGIEACISLPNHYGKVPRAKKVTVESLNMLGETQMYNLEGWLARLFQHEIDHLDGILYPLRMREGEKLVYQPVYAKKAESALKALITTEESKSGATFKGEGTGS